PLNPKWLSPGAELRREVGAAQGLLAERFALCQALPFERLEAVTEGLRHAGYRPVRGRAWRGGGGFRGPAKPPAAGEEVPRAAERIASGRLRLSGAPGVASSPRVAVVWSRDGLDWKLQTGLTDKEVLRTAAVRERRLLPADVAGYRTAEGDRYALLWQQAG